MINWAPRLGVPYSLYDFLGFVIPGAGILAAVVLGWNSEPHFELAGGAAMTAVVFAAASFVVGHVNAGIATLLEPMAWGRWPGSRVLSTWGLFGEGGKYSSAEHAHLIKTLQQRYPGPYSDQTLFDLAYSTALGGGRSELFQVLNGQIAFYRNAASACGVAATIFLIYALMGHANLVWAPVLVLAVPLLVVRYRRLWTRFGDHVVRFALVGLGIPVGGASEKEHSR